MTTLVSAVTTVFTPTAPNFIVQCTAGNANLERRNTSGAAWALVGKVDSGAAMVVDNPVSGAQYRFVQADDSVTAPTVQADE